MHKNTKKYSLDYTNMFTNIGNIHPSHTKKLIFIKTEN